MNFGRHEVTGFQYATTLSTVRQFILPKFGTAEAGLRKVIKITDIKGNAAGSARAVEIGGLGGSYKKISLTFPANSTPNYSFDMPYTLETVSSTGTSCGLYASAAANSEINIIITGFIDRKN